MGRVATNSRAADAYRRSARPLADPSSLDGPLTPAERRLRILLRALTVFFFLITPLYLLGSIAIPGQADWAQVGFSVNSAAKDAVFGFTCIVAVSNLRRFDWLVPFLAFAHLVVIFFAVVILIAADTSRTYDVLGTDVSLTAATIGAIVIDTIVAALLVGFYIPARRARFELKFLPPAAFESLAALADVVVVRAEEQIAPEEVARNVDNYMHSFGARRKWIIPVALVALWLYPLRYLKAPFPVLAPDERRKFFEKRLNDIATRRTRLFRRPIEAIVRLAQQMAFLGYYGDERTNESVGYTRFKDRDHYEERLKKATPHERLEVVDHGDVRADTIDADVLVIGSGAGGSVAAYRLAEAGRKVLVIEGGKHVDPSDFRDDEIHQISQLYADGALQQSRDFSFQVLQGKCVGGSTTVNNAVCFDLPERVLQHWNGPLAAGIEPSELRESFARVRKLMRIGRPPSEHLEGGWPKFVEGARALGLDKPPYNLNVVDANISDCPGSGYCNIGCPYGNKLSMLVTLLPEAQRRFGTDALRVLPECLAEKVETDGRRVREVVARMGDRRIRIKAKTVVVSGSAIASPWLLMQSKIARGRAGRRISFNMGSPITAAFDEPLDSFDGVQISHFLEPPDGSGYVLETWFNPVVSQALNMPGWLDDHWRNMREFRNLTAAGVLVGTTTEKARIRRALTGGADVDYEPGRGDAANEDDMRRLIDGLKLLCRIFLAAGATRVMPNTFQYHEFTDPDQIDRLDAYVRDASDLAVGSGHPQGGNAMSVEAGRGVVGPDCKVHGFDNLYVCDSSVFPGSSTVYPQLTVMAIADMVAPGIAAS